MGPVILPAQGNRALAVSLARALGADLGDLTARQFPDGEHYLRVDTPVEGRHVAIACTLYRPDESLLPLLLLAATVRDLGAASVGLVAPYLAFMRQDERFSPGEAVTSSYVAKMISDAVDWVVTVDPHLHRYESLGQLYTVPTTAVRAAPAIAGWLVENVTSPVLIGPDAEANQWVRDICEATGAPSVILDKTRSGDRDVRVTAPSLEAWKGHTPVLVDDIISTGMTMRGAIEHLDAAGLTGAVCIGVHAVFAGDAHKELLACAGRVVTCNTIVHTSNAIRVDDALAAAVRERLQAP